MQSRRTPSRLRRPLWLVRGCSLALLASAALALAAEAPKRTFNVAADVAERALRRFAEQAGIHLIFPPEITRGVRTRDVRGELSVGDAASRLLEGTNLQLVADKETGVYALARATPAPESPKKKASQTSENDETMKRNSLFSRLGVMLAAVIGTPGGAQDSAAADALAQRAQGVITGHISNRGTGAFLEGALVRVEGTNEVVRTESDGSYRLTAPAGKLMLSVTYIGLDAQRMEVSVPAGATVVRDFELTTGIYQLAPVVIAGEREGDALAITRQRQAAGIKNVVSADAFGSLAGNPADLLQHMPGITVDRVGGDVRYIQIRGIDGDLNSVQVDGNRIASTGADGRGFQFQNVGSDHIESMEVVKSPTPDIDADSIGGAVNIRSRSGFDLKERRIAYSLGAVIGYERDDPHFAGTFSYSDALSVFGGQRNLGVAFNVGYREHRATLDNVRQDFQNIDASPAYRWRTEVRDFTNIRTRYGGGLRVDYKLSPESSVFANFTVSPHEEDGPSMTMVLQNAQSIATISPTTGLPTGTGAVMPGFTDERTEVRPLTTSFMNLINLMHDRKAFSGSGQVGGRIRKPAWELDYDTSYSYARNNLWNYSSTITLRGIGWITDTTGQDRFSPTITFTGGPSSFNLDNFTENSLTHLDSPVQNEVMGAQINYRRKLHLGRPTLVKTGLKYRAENQERWNYNQRWTYLGADGTMGTADDRLSQFQDRSYSYAPVDGAYPARPFQSTRAMVDDLAKNPGLWQEDIAYRVQQNLRGRRSLEEEVLAAYLMGTVEFGALSVLAGARVEQTDVTGSGSVQNLTAAERARRAAWVGPVTADETIRRNVAEYGGRLTTKRDYRNVFPGVHLKYEPIDRLVLRASFSTSIGRPAFTALTPNDTVSDDTRIVQASNPGLKPQYSDNFDLSAEYYLRPAGLISVGAFRKDIKDFIYNSAGTIILPGADNGFNGAYEGYELRTQANGGFAKIEGMEFNYQQQLRFLPGWLEGFRVFANYTKLRTEGDYGDLGNVQRTGELPGFKPEAANAGLSYIRGRLSLRAIYNYNGRMLLTTNARDNLKQYLREEDRVDLKLKFTLNRHLDLYCDVYNVFNSKYTLEYGGVHSRPRTQNDRHDPQFHIGINGRL